MSPNSSKNTANSVSNSPAITLKTAIRAGIRIANHNASLVRTVLASKGVTLNHNGVSVQTGRRS